MPAARKAFLLRLNESLHAELEAWAKDEMRSLNGHIEFLLRESVRRRRGGKAPPASDADPGDDDESSA